MAGGVIHAAWIQAVPVAFAAGAAIYGLTTWRHQVRGQRQIEHAEKAMASAVPAFSLVRAARSPFMGMPEEDAVSRSKREAARTRIIAGRLERAWDAWQRLNEHYVLAGFFTERPEGSLDVSMALAECIYDLRDSAEMMASYHDEDGDPSDPYVRENRKQYAIHRKDFSGSRDPANPDEIEVRLREAEAALKKELLPILRPQMFSARVKASCLRWWISVTRNKKASDQAQDPSPSS